jgi:hypothetical protein
MAELKRKSPWDEPAPVEAPAPTVQKRTVEVAPAAEPLPVAVPMRRINFDVPADLHRQIRMKVASEGVTIAEVGRQLLEEWLKDRAGQ